MANKKSHRPAGVPTEPPPKEHPAKLGGFEIIESIGKGGMGDVYKARQVSMDRLIALKILSRRLAGSKAYVQRFVREARAAAKLNHPNIVQGIDVGKAAGCYYFAMEFIDGETAHEQLKRAGPLDEEDALRICLQVAQALHHAHDRAGIIHRDVKPQNILIGQDGVAKLADLGLARHTEQGDLALGAAGPSPDAASPGSLTVVGTTLGTPDYISPEQIRGEEDLDGRCDVYSLGATLYDLLIGKPAYVADSANIVMAKHLSEPVPDIRAARPDISPNTAAIVWRSMQKDKRERYQSAEEMAVALEGALRRRSDPARAGAAPRAAGPAVHVRRPRRQSPQLAAWIAGAALVLAAVGVMVWRPWKSGGQPTKSPVTSQDRPREQPPDGPSPEVVTPGKAAYEGALRIVRDNKKGAAAVIGELRSILAACRGTEYEDRVRALLNRTVQQVAGEADAALGELKARAERLMGSGKYAEAMAMYDVPPPALESPRERKRFQDARALVRRGITKAYQAKSAAARAAADAGDFDKAVAIMRSVRAWGLPRIEVRATEAIDALKAEKAAIRGRAQEAERRAMTKYAIRIFAALKERDYALAARGAGEAAGDKALGSAREQFEQFQADIGLCESLWQDAAQRLSAMKPGASIRLRGIKRPFVSFESGVLAVKGLAPILLREMRSSDLFALIDADHVPKAAEPLRHFKRGLFHTFDRERKLDRARAFFERVAASDKAMAARGRWYVTLIGEVEPEQGALMLLEAARAAARNKDWTLLGAKLAALKRFAKTRTWKASATERTSLELLAAGQGLGPDALFSGNVALKGAGTITITYDLSRKDHRRDWRGGTPKADGLRVTRALRWKGGVKIRSAKLRLSFPARRARSELRLMCDERGGRAVAVAAFGQAREPDADGARRRAPFTLAVGLTDTEATFFVDGKQVAQRELALRVPSRGSIVLVRSRKEVRPVPLDVSSVVVTGKLDLDWARARLALLASIAKSESLGTVRVPADKVWTDSGVDLARGKYYLLRAKGRWQYSARASGGASAVGVTALHRGLPFYSLVGRTDGDVFTVGDELVVGPNSEGRLFLGMNDTSGRFGDNSGAMAVEIRQVPGPRTLRYEPGLVAVAYAGTNFERFARRSVTQTLRFRLGDLKRIAGRTTAVSVRWTGYLRIEEGGVYGLAFSSDDGFRMWLDGKKIFDVWKPSRENKDKAPPMQLTRGYHRIQIEYFQGRGNAHVSLHWRRRNRDHRLVPAGALFHAVVEQ